MFINVKCNEWHSNRGISSCYSMKTFENRAKLLEFWGGDWFRQCSKVYLFLVRLWYCVSQRNFDQNFTEHVQHDTCRSECKSTLAFLLKLFLKSEFWKFWSQHICPWACNLESYDIQWNVMFWIVTKKIIQCPMPCFFRTFSCENENEKT